MIKVLHRFIKRFVKKISLDTLKFRGRESEHSFILNSNPYPSDKFYVSNGVFLRENEPVLLKFTSGRPLYSLKSIKRIFTILCRCRDI